MNIKSVEFALDGSGNKLSLQVLDEDGDTHFAPIDGVTAVNQAIDAWIAEGNAVAPGTIPPPSE